MIRKDVIVWKRFHKGLKVATRSWIGPMFCLLCLMLFSLPNMAAATSPITQLSAGDWLINYGAFFMALRSDGTVWRFQSAFNTYPSNLNSMAISQGLNDYLVLQNDGTIHGYGSPSSCELGRNFSQVGGLTDVIAICEGWDSTLVVKSDGTVWGLGSRANGQLGTGSTGPDICVPMQALGMSGATAVSIKGRHTVALKNDGTVWTWGWNGSGQLGDGTYTDHYLPRQIPSLTGVIAIAAGGGDSEGHTVVLKNNGTIWAWGSNFSGQLGDGTTTNRPSPMQVPGLSGIVAIAAGASNTVALKNDGTVWRWGTGDYYNPQPYPEQVTGISGVTVIAAGYYDILAAKNDGTVWRWGAGDFNSPHPYPVQIADTPLTIDFTGNGSGTVSLSYGGSCTYASTEVVPGQTSITLTPSAATGSSFAAWSGCDSVIGNQCVVTMNGSRSVTAEFDVQTFTDSYSSAGNGAITSSAGTVNYDGSITFTMTPSAGFTLRSLTDNGSVVRATVGSNGTYLYTLSNVTSNHTLSASFKILYQVTAAVIGTGGTVSPSTTFNYYEMYGLPFILTPQTGYTLDRLTDNGVNVTSEAYVDGNVFKYDFDFTNMNQNHSIQVTYKVGSIQRTVPASSLPGLIFIVAGLNCALYLKVRKKGKLA